MNNYILSVGLAFLFNLCIGQEVCNNCIDDDGDGFIDCYDTDCKDQCNDFYFSPSDTTIASFTHCLTDSAQPITGTLSLLWETDTTLVSGLYTPVVGDIDADNIAEIVIQNKLRNRIFIYDGVTGATENIITTSGIMNSVMLCPTIGDIDNDGLGEIIVQSQNGTLQCYEHDGTLKWISDSTVTLGPGAGIADFDADGNPEVYAGSAIFEGATGKLIVEDFTVIGANKFHKRQSVAADVLSFHNIVCTDCEGLELVVYDQVYSVNISTKTLTVKSSYPVMTGENSSRAHVVDWNMDNQLDIVVNGGGGIDRLVIWNPKDASLIASAPISAFNPSVGTYLSIGNVDDDPEPELGFENSANKTYIVIDNDLSIIWQKPVRDASSGSTGSSMFDFNCDLKMDIAFRDEFYLLIMDGATGAVWDSMPCRSNTLNERPVVADVNNDGKANILCTCGINGANTDMNIKSYEGLNNWPSARKVMNQPAYFNVNINDDLSVPCEQQNHALLNSGHLNSFTAQSTIIENGLPNCASLLKDISIVVDSTYCRDGEQAVTLSMKVCNNNILPLEDSISINIFDQQDTTNAIIDLDSLISIQPFECSSIKLSIPSEDSLNLLIKTSIINNDECEYSNNIDYASTPKCKTFFFLPNAFSPNGDGLNDFLAIRSSGIEIFQLSIYDRYGKTIFTSVQPDDKWDATFKEQAVPNGTYTYQLSYTDLTGMSYSSPGTITIIR